MANIRSTAQVETGQPARRAAQYVRMSTDMQKYSTENQAAAIAAYAAERRLSIVRTYVDHGRSGLRIDRRKGLQALISDVQERKADYDFVLVYDVSRWGRFQDVDESAYYEFICKKAGIKVLYCAEQFENDGSFVAAIMKNIRRVAAGDYSRDLSARVFAGSCRVVSLGFKQGGTAGYGLQRVWSISPGPGNACWSPVTASPSRPTASSCSRDRRSKSRPCGGCFVLSSSSGNRN